MSKNMLQFKYRHFREALKMKKFGFTLAEILIALAIVGVIAAISIPTMVMESNKKVWANSLAVAVSNFENATTTYIITEGKSSIYEIKDFSSVQNIKALFLKELSKTKIQLTLWNDSSTGIKQYYSKNPMKSLQPKKNESILSFVASQMDSTMTTAPVWESKNGVAYSLFSVKQYSQNEDFEDLKMSHPVGVIMIDVTGQKGPNRLGRDIFFFVLNQDGYLFPYNGKEYIEYMKAKGSAGSSFVASLTSALAACNPNPSGLFGLLSLVQHGTTCAARLVENGFKMDY